MAKQPVQFFPCNHSVPSDVTFSLERAKYYIGRPDASPHTSHKVSEREAIEIVQNLPPELAKHVGVKIDEDSEVGKASDEIQRLAGQIDKLGEYILMNHSEEIADEGAVDVAIRLLSRPEPVSFAETLEQAILNDPETVEKTLLITLKEQFGYDFDFGEGEPDPKDIEDEVDQDLYVPHDKEEDPADESEPKDDTVYISEPRDPEYYPVDEQGTPLSIPDPELENDQEDPEPSGEEDTEVEIDKSQLPEMNTRDLRALARAKTIKNYSNMTKDELIESLMKE
jgi:hypothetical protein